MPLPKPGDVFESRYHLDEVLGAGGFATVFMATDTRSARRVAIKVLRPDPGYTATLRARFEREVRVIGNLRDEHTVKMFDHGTSADGLLYMVTEYIEGEDLEQLLARRDRLEPGEVVHILRQVLSALHEAHSAGLLHRDIKPGNIRVYAYMGDELKVKLLDFGIAKDVHDTDQLTADGELVGTVRYMSPEQLMSAPLNASSDIYSLGVVAFELLLGSGGIHGGALHEQLDRLATGHLFSAPEIARLGPLAAVLHRMTARKPEDRFKTAAQVIDALAAPAPLAAPVQASAPLVRPPRATNGTPPWLPGALVLLLLAVLVGAGVALNTPDRAEPAASPPTKRAPNPLLVAAQAHEGSTTSPVVLEPAREVVSPGCGEDPGFAGHGDFRHVDGFDVVELPAFVPTTYRPEDPSALVVMLPENGDTTTQFIDYSGMKALAVDHGFVIVAVRQPVYGWADETLAVRAIQDAIDLARASTCVDPKRIFVIGHANGGRAAEYAAAAIPEVAAIAVTSFRTNVNESKPSGPHTAPYLFLAPLKDGYNVVEGGISCDGETPYLSLSEHEKHWRERYDCDNAPTTYLEKGAHICTTWTCETPYVTCHLDGGRNWPGQPHRIWDDLSGQNCDGTPADFPFAETIWRFFDEQTPNSE